MPLSRQRLDQVGRSARSRPAAAQPEGVQPVADGVAVHTQLAGDLDQCPRPLGHAVSQIRPEISKAELAGASGEALVGGAAALACAADLRRGAVDAGLVDEAADHVNGGVKLAGELRQAGVVLAARRQVAVEVGEAEGVSAVVQTPLLTVDGGETASDEEAAVHWGCRWCFPCARSAGRPANPGDPPSSSLNAVGVLLIMRGQAHG
jgi:hypothetical protein